MGHSVLTGREMLACRNGIFATQVTGRRLKSPRNFSLGNIEPTSVQRVDYSTDQLPQSALTVGSATESLVVRSAEPYVARMAAILSTGRKDTAQEAAWSRLIGNIREGDCVPFLGAGACVGHIPLGGQLAREWGGKMGYPLRDKANLPSVMQYIATVGYEGDAMSLKRDFARIEFQGIHPPDFGEPGQIHSVLARCDLSLYVSTNFDDFMTRALQYWRKQPRLDYSPWYGVGEGTARAGPLADRLYEPTPTEPLVFHLHGIYSDPPSLVLTEDDYIEFLVRLATDTTRRAGTVSASEVLPTYVRSQLRTQPLLFIGYSLRDWTFLVLFRTLLHGIPFSQRRNHVSVQVDPNERASKRARQYLEQYFSTQRIRIFWASAHDFADELSSRLGGAGT